MKYLNTDTSKIKSHFEFIYKGKLSMTTKSCLKKCWIPCGQNTTDRTLWRLQQCITMMLKITGGETFVKEKMNIDKYWESLGSDFGGTWELESI